MLHSYKTRDWNWSANPLVCMFCFAFSTTKKILVWASCLNAVRLIFANRWSFEIISRGWQRSNQASCNHEVMGGRARTSFPRRTARWRTADFRQRQRAYVGRSRWETTVWRSWKRLPRRKLCQPTEKRINPARISFVQRWTKVFVHTRTDGKLIRN